MAHLLMAIKAAADNYEEGCEYLNIGIVGNHISIGNNPEKEGYYSFWFTAGDDIDNAEIVDSINDSSMSWISKSKF